MVNIINNISDKQNEKGLLNLQFCARHLYNKAKTLNYISWICCIIVTVIMPFVSEIIGITEYLIIIGFNILIIVIDWFTNRFVKLGAAYKMLFDYTLFQIPNCDNFHGYTIDVLKVKAAEIILRHPKSYQRETTHNGTTKPKGVMDWYYSIPKDLNHTEAVKRCQEQNKYFDRNIMIRTWWLFVGFVGIIVAIFYVINHNNDFLISVLVLFSGSAILEKIITEITGFVKVYNTCVILDWMKAEPEISLNLKQKIIDERRTKNIVATSIIYRIISYRLHSTIKAKDSIILNEEE